MKSGSRYGGEDGEYKGVGFVEIFKIFDEVQNPNDVIKAESEMSVEDSHLSISTLYQSDRGFTHFYVHFTFDTTDVVSNVK